MRVVALTAADIHETERYFEDWKAWLAAAVAAGGLQKAEWRRREPLPPVAAVQAAALHHPNARVRHDCLSALDHHANEASAEIFRKALNDPVPRVRTIALHGLACERCRESELCVSDVVPALTAVLESDPSPKVRHDAVRILVRLSSRDERAGKAIQMATADNDPLVSAVATAAVDGRRRDIGSRKALRRRARAEAARLG